MKFNSKTFLLCLFIIAGMVLITTDSIKAAYSPHSVESTVRNNWNDTYGYKHSNMRLGNNIVYDVYYEKYSGFDGGYRIVNRNFGSGTQPYLNFRGWAINFGYKKHTSTNHDTYIVAQNRSTRSVKIYKTDHLNLSATEDVEYNNQGSGVWNECSASATKKDNIEDCNMRYDNVGFDAYLPLEDLFPDISKDYSYNLFIVKEVDGHIVYTPLVLPFEFDKHTYQGGEVDLTSGVNVNKLLMIGTNVLKRGYPRQSAGNASGNGYFSTGYTYTKIDSDETETAIWYGVSTNGTKRWGSTAYWDFGGDQAQLNFKADDKPPVHISHSLSSHIYKNGNDYWTQPNDQVVINLRQRDVDSGNKYQYLRLYGSSQDVRSRHTFSSGASTKTNLNGYTSSYISIDSATRTENTTYGRVNWYVTPKRHGDTYNVHYYYTDLANNSIGYNDTGMNLRVDGVAPSHQSQSIVGAGYVNGSTYWVNSGDSLTITARQRDPHSGNKYQYLRALNNGNASDIEARSRHNFSEATTYHNKQVSSSNFNISSVKRTEHTGTGYGTVQWTTIPRGHGKLFTVQRYYQDNVNNNSGYATIGTVGVDDIGPLATFNPNSKDWTLGQINVKATITDEHSGVKRFRYRISNKGSWDSWSSWISGTQVNITLSKSGVNQIQIQAEDNLGNLKTTNSGYYYINTRPIANFDWSTKPVYEGNTVSLENLSTDPDNHKMTAKWDITNPSGNKIYSSSWDTTLPNVIPGIYKVHLTITDEHGAASQIEKQIEVLPVEIYIGLEHIPKWKDYYIEEGRDLRAFLAGEPFLTNVSTVPTADKVVVDFNFPFATKEVPEQFLYNPYDDPYPDFAHSFDLNLENNLWTIEAWRKYWIMIPDGNYSATIKVTFTNGLYKEKNVPITILDHIFYNKKEGYSN